jgi:hypothetical protein
VADIPTLKITISLADGGSVYEPGDLVNIEWELDLDSNDNEFPLWQLSRNLHIFLCDDSGNKLNLASQGITRSSGRIDPYLENEVSPKSGIYNAPFPDNPVQWKLPYNLAAGEYTILVHRKDHPAQGGLSAAFTLVVEYELEITSPTISEEWEKGTIESITWDQTDIDTATEGTLYYRPIGGDNKDWVEIATLTEDGERPGQTGSYDWTLPINIDAGQYQIGMLLDYESFDSGDDQYYAVTDDLEGFAISDRTIEITAPISGEKILEGTSDYSITWTPSSGYSSSDELSIYYRVDGGDWMIIEGGISANAGTYTWNITGLDVGAYEIAFRDSYYEAEVGGTDQIISDTFYIIAKDISIIFPCAGALVHRGTGGAAESYKIEWTYEGYADNDTITIWIKEANQDWVDETQLTDSPVQLDTDSFTWEIPSTLATGPYNMRIKRGTDIYPATDFTFAVSDSLQDFNALTRLTSLVVVQKSKIYYTQGSWIKQLTDADGEDALINAAGHVAVIPAFQKVFICDGNHREDPTYPGFRFIDFGNLRMVGTLTGELIAGDILVGQINGSIIIVDWLDTSGVDDILYGKVVSGGTIGAGEEFELDASNNFVVDSWTDPPHWADWDEAIFAGSLPDVATIGCLWKGRIVLLHEHQWYASREGNPFDWQYAAGDALSAISGGDHTIGKVGDIGTALIPYDADTLLIGTQSSVEIMRGNPTQGSLDMYYQGDGIFGPQSWCIDNNNILYWIGLGGFYEAAVGSSYPKNISQDIMPKLMDGVTRKTHWITLVFDVERNGILIFITNSNINAKPSEGEAYGTTKAYWYSLVTGGLFPEKYPPSCGVFCAMNFLPETVPSWYVAAP